MSQNTNEMKVCKHCHSEIPKKAKVCPQCRKKQGGIGKTILIVLVVLFLLGSFGGSEEETKTTSETVANNSEVVSKVETVENTSPETEEVTQEPEVVEIVYTPCKVDEMMDMLEENALKAEKTYQDQHLEITGRLSVIDSDGSYISLYPLNDEWAFTGVQCFIQDDEQLNQVLEMKIGDTVTVKGQITNIGEVIGYTMDIDSIN